MSRAVSVSVGESACSSNPSTSTGITLVVRVSGNAVALDATAPGDVSQTDLQALVDACAARLAARPSEKKVDEAPRGSFNGKTLVTIGNIVGTMSYVASVAAVFGTTSCTGSFGIMGGEPLHCHSYSGWLLVPYVGSTIALFDNINKPTMQGEMAFYAVSTVVNVGALATIIVGAVLPSSRRARIKPTFEASARGATVGVGGTF
jgi:hypothetical protein